MKNKILSLLTVLIALTAISCGQLWKIDKSSDVTFQIDITELTKSQSSILLQTVGIDDDGLSNLPEAIISLHNSATDAHIASKAVLFTDDTEIIVTFPSLAIVDQTIYAKITVVLGGLHYEGRSNAQRIIAGDNNLLISELYIAPGSIGYIYFNYEGNPATENDLNNPTMDLDNDGAYDTSISEYVEELGLDLEDNILTITRAFTEQRHSTVSDFIQGYYDVYGGIFDRDTLTLTIDLAYTPIGYIEFTYYDSPANSNILGMNTLDTDGDGTNEHSVATMTEAFGAYLINNRAEIEGMTKKETLVYLDLYQGLFGGQIVEDAAKNETTLTVEMTEVEQPLKKGVIVFTNGQYPATTEELDTTLIDVGSGPISVSNFVASQGGELFGHIATLSGDTPQQINGALQAYATAYDGILTGNVLVFNISGWSSGPTPGGYTGEIVFEYNGSTANENQLNTPISSMGNASVAQLVEAQSAELTDNKVIIAVDSQSELDFYLNPYTEPPFSGIRNGNIVTIELSAFF